MIRKVYKNAKITKRSHAKKGYASPYNVEILNSLNNELELKDTESAIRNELKYVLTKLEGFKFMTTLVLGFKKIESDNETKYGTFYLASKTKTVINESNIDNVFESIYNMILSNTQNSLRKGSG